MNAPLNINPLAAAGMQQEIVTLAVPEDERVWVPQAPGVWFRPLMLNTVSGGWFNLLRVRKSEDVFTKIELCRKHYEQVGLGADYVNQFVR